MLLGWVPFSTFYTLSASVVHTCIFMYIGWVIADHVMVGGPEPVTGHKSVRFTASLLTN